jgi:DNA-binding transcriptional LysR family regulator
MQFTLKQLRYLVAVAQTGNVSVAARNLFITQPALSSAVAQLESSVGLPLLIRHHARGISLTPAGRQFLAQARGLLGHADELELFGKELGNSVSGELALGCFTTIAPFFLPNLLKTAKLSYPELQIQLAEGTLDQVQASLLAGETEIGLVYDIDLDHKLATEELTRVHPHVLMASNHRLAHKPVVSLSELTAEPMILLDLPHSRDYFRNLFLDAGTEPKIGHRTQSFELVRGLVGRGHGYSVLNLQPRSNQTYDGGRVKCIPILGPTTDLPIVITWLDNLQLTRRAQAFVSECRVFFSE